MDHLEDNIHRVIADIRPQMLEKVIENWTSRLDYIQASRSRPMPEIIFKMYCHKNKNSVHRISGVQKSLVIIGMLQWRSVVFRRLDRLEISHAVPLFGLL
ncbi:hypothetical protein TNCV_593601 [Trichonephila clavipes]|nr:hypothetical protein TNCV_593601 [Trichonephila clavipes]